MPKTLLGLFTQYLSTNNSVTRVSLRECIRGRLAGNENLYLYLQRYLNNLTGE